MLDSTFSIQRGERTVGLLLVLTGAVGLIIGLASGHVLVGALCAAVVGICLSILGFRILLRGNHRP